MPPVTTPVLWKKFQGVAIWPPLQPIEKQLRKLQQPTVSAVDSRGASAVHPALMLTRSLNASVVPKAQQDPQLAWSRMVLMLLQLGHAVRESKLAGATISSI